MRFANSWRDYKSTFAAKEFFIVHKGGDYFFSVYFSRQLCRQLKLFQQRNDIISLLGSESRPFHRNAAGRCHPHRDAIAVRNFEVGGAFDRVPDGVPKIQERAFPENLASIGHHDPGFDRDIAPDKRDESVILRSKPDWHFHSG